MAVLKGTTALLRSLAALVQLFRASPAKRDEGLGKAQARTHTFTQLAEEGSGQCVQKRCLIFCHPFVFAGLSICISLISSPFLPHSHFIDFKSLSFSLSCSLSLSLSHTHTHTLTKSARCGLTFPIYPEGGGLIEIYNDYQEAEEEYIVAV